MEPSVVYCKPPGPFLWRSGRQIPCKPPPVPEAVSATVVELIPPIQCHKPRHQVSHNTPPLKCCLASADFFFFPHTEPGVIIQGRDDGASYVLSSVQLTGIVHHHIDQVPRKPVFHHIRKLICNGKRHQHTARNQRLICVSIST